MIHKKGFSLLVGFLAFLLPFWGLMWFIVHNFEEGIRFEQFERYGVSYSDAIFRLIVPLQTYRGVSANLKTQATKPSDKLGFELGTLKQHIAQRIDELERVDAEHGKSLNANARWQAIRGEIEALQQSRTLSAEDEFSAYKALIYKLIELNHHIGDTSNLILDPVLSRYYLMDISLNITPAMVENIAIIRGEGLAFSGQGNFADDFIPDIQKQAVRAELKAETFARAIKNVQDEIETAQTALAPAFKQVVEKQKRFLEYSKTLANRQFLDIEARRFFAQGSEIISLYSAIHAAALEKLDTLLRESIDQKRFYVRWIYALALLVTIMALLLLRVLYQAKKLKDTESERSLAILTTAVDGIITIDAEANIQSFNPSAERMFGYSAEEVIGKNVKLLMPEPYHSEHDDYVKNYQQTGQAKVIGIGGREVVALRKDGTEFPMALGIGRFEADGKPMFVGMVRDISEWKHAQESLMDAKEQAEHANQLKSEFLATMSHEIRTPMNGIIGMTELLMETRLDNKQHGYANTVLNSADSLLHIINDILDFSKIEAGKFELECAPFNLRSSCEEVADLLAAKTKGGIVELILRYPPHVAENVIGDSDRLRQIITNFLGNAIKFTESGYILLSVEEVAALDLADEQVKFKISIEDTGIGIAEDAQNKIFEKFSQADASITRKYGGTGLGLAICQQLAAMMDGEVGLSSVPGEGSTFWFTVVLDRAPARTQTQATDIDTFSGLNLLLVDDITVNGHLLAEHLSDADMHCDLAFSGEQALDLVKDKGQDFYHMMLLDYRMPNMDGIELAMALRKNLGTQCPPLVLFSCETIMGQLYQSIVDSFEGFIAKPVRRAQMRELLALVWQKYQAGKREYFITTEDLRSGGAKEERSLSRPINALYVDNDPISQTLAAKLFEKLGGHVHALANGNEALKWLQQDNPDIDIAFMKTQLPGMNGYQLASAITERMAEAQVPKLPLILVTTDEAEEYNQQTADEANVAGYLSKPLKRKPVKAILEKYVPSAFSSKTVQPVHQVFPELKVLLAEDNETNREFMGELFASFRCHCDMAEDGVQAVEKFKANHYDIIFMDMQMPNMDGLTATGKIRKIENQKAVARTPIIALTANALKSDEERCKQAGMDDYLSKPVKKSAIQDRLLFWADDHKQEIVKESPKASIPINGANGEAAGMDIKTFAAYLKITNDKAPVMLAKTLDFVATSLQDIQGFVSTSEFEQATKLAHKLKSSSGQMGAAELSRLMAEIEKYSAAEDPNKLRETLPEAGDAFVETKSFINKWLDSG